MEHYSDVEKVWIILTCSLHLSSADTHSLQYFYTTVTGINLPEFISVSVVDGEPFEYYDSNIRKTIPKTEWIKKIDTDFTDYWKERTQFRQSQQEWFQDDVATAMQSFNQTKGVHIAQFMFGCELDDDGTTRGYSYYGYDGEDFFSLDQKTVSWTAAKPEALITERKWESTGREAKYCRDFLKHECIEWLKKFVSYGKETLERKVPPTASVFQKHSSSPEVVCHATGFFPKTVNITWQKDGKDVHEDVDLRETLPNQDGSFQKRSILRVSAEDLQKHTYTCVIKHSSLEKEIVLPEKDIQILNPCVRPIGGSGGGSGGGSVGAPIGIIVGVVASLIALVAVVSGIVVWRRKNSGFKPVPPKPTSERDPQSSMSSLENDSSSNNS
ncbi:hypothetical protein AMELA_G00242450 [Ameiurus melas]|uniref:Ig-like domain-containing protein n=1 Tax=Ameiurus melas TaxID=219545 RepID=A0A7J5ZXN5_AMEME|nr:hypothetical protein AMELA_G00242450 [Ameiurus melas]